MSYVAHHSSGGSQSGSCFVFLVLVYFLVSFGSVGAAELSREQELAERWQFVRMAMDEHVNSAIAKTPTRGLAVETLVPFGDWDFYWLKGRGLQWTPNPGQKFHSVQVPMGFVTDLTSIPRLFWQVARPEGRYAFAAVVHDYLYWVQTRSRAEADQILKFAMQDSKVDRLTIETIYNAVRSPFGERAWNNNAQLKKSGERRFLKEFPTDFTISWSSWKKRPNVFAD